VTRSVSDIVTFEADGHVAVITLNRPEARNAVNREVAQGIEAAIDRLEDDPELWVGILAANTAGQERPVFCAGADLKELSAGNGAALSTARGGFAGFAYRDRRKPVIVAVDGLATAGGCEIALAADIVVATTRSAFGLAEVKRSLVAGAGGLFRLPRAVGQGPALEMILTGEPMPAERAYQLGLVARLAEPSSALDTARQLAAQITKAAPLAVWESRAVVLAASSENDHTLKQMTDAAMAAMMSSDDLAEGLTAFIEKRDPVWKGR
jgi:enoyl-CoA hydratase